MAVEPPSGGGGGSAPPLRAKRAPWGPPRASAPRAGGPALEAMYPLLLWLIPRLRQFPRSQKFLLADHLQQQAIAVLDELINATCSRERQAMLRAANLGLERLRFGVRLAKSLRHLDLKAYEPSIARTPRPSSGPHPQSC